MRFDHPVVLAGLLSVSTLMTPNAEAADSIPFTAKICGVDHKLMLHPPTNEETSITDFRVVPGQQVGRLQTAALPAAALVSHYGYVIENPGKWLAWWHEPTVKDPAEFIQQVRSKLDDCHDLGHHGYITPGYVSTRDVRFRLDDGSGVGSTFSGVKASHTKGELNFNNLTGDPLWEIDGLTYTGNQERNQVSEVRIAIPAG